MSASTITAEELLGDAPVGSELAMVGDAYQAASRYNRDVASWQPSLRSADGDIISGKPLLDARARDVTRNDAYIASGADLNKDNIVGGMYLLNSKPYHKVLGLDETWAEEFQDEVEAKFTLYAESPNNWLDASRMGSLTAQVRLAVGVYVASGEVLSSVEWLREPGRPFSTAVQMIDVDRLSTPWGMEHDLSVRGGVHRNKYGAPLGYHVRQAHPTDWQDTNSWKWKYVAARKPWGRMQMIHILEQLRPDQTRGVAAMVSALKEIRMTKQFKDIVLQNAVVNATYAASIESELPSEAVFASLGVGEKDPMGSYFKNYMTNVAEFSAGARNISMDGVRIPHLLPGTKLQLRPAGQGGPLGTEFEQSLLRYIAASLGVSYEQLSRDYSQTNYSSIRAAMTETWKYMQSRKRMVADRYASILFRLWLEEAINKGEITSLPRRAPSWYDGLNADAYSACEWIGASRGQIDELKETQAAVLRLKYNLSTREDELARQGKDWRTVLVQLEREKKEMDARGLTPDEGGDNMMNASTGAPREKEAKGEKDDGSEDNTK